MSGRKADEAMRSPFEGRLIRLRAREEADLAVLNPMFDEPDVLAGLMMAFPQPMEGIRGWWQGTRDQTNAAHFVIETLEGEVVGVCSLERVDARARDAELGIWIGKPYWHRGYATDAMRTVCRFGFEQMNLQRITLHVYETNPRAQAVYERVGFRVEGTKRRGQFVDGGWVDVHIMGLLAEELADG